MNEEYTITSRELGLFIKGKVVAVTALAIYGRIKQQCQKHGACALSASALGKEYGLSRQNVENIISKLKRMGLIKTRAIKGVGRTISCIE